jgi:hypothetical protein
MYKNEQLIDSQYGFMPQKITTDSMNFLPPLLQWRQKINRTGITKREICYNHQPKRQRNFRRSVVAKHPKGLERLRVP